MHRCAASNGFCAPAGCKCRTSRRFPAVWGPLRARSACVAPAEFPYAAQQHGETFWTPPRTTR